MGDVGEAEARHEDEVRQRGRLLHLAVGGRTASASRRPLAGTQTEAARAFQGLCVRPNTRHRLEAVSRCSALVENELRSGEQLSLNPLAHEGFVDAPLEREQGAERVEKKPRLLGLLVPFPVIPEEIQSAQDPDRAPLVSAALAGTALRKDAIPYCLSHFWLVQLACAFFSCLRIETPICPGPGSCPFGSRLRSSRARRAHGPR